MWRIVVGIRIFQSVSSFRIMRGPFVCWWWQIETFHTELRSLLCIFKPRYSINILGFERSSRIALSSTSIRFETFSLRGRCDLGSSRCLPIGFSTRSAVTKQNCRKVPITTVSCISRIDNQVVLLWGIFGAPGIISLWTIGLHEDVATSRLAKVEDFISCSRQNFCSILTNYAIVIWRLNYTIIVIFKVPITADRTRHPRGKTMRWPQRA